MELLIRNIKQSKQLTFACSGNIIRSAFAELLTKHLVKEKMISSLGTEYHNSQIHPQTKRILLDKGIESIKIDNFQPTHISKINPTAIENIIFFSMTNDHKAKLEKYFGPKIKSYLLREIMNENREIEDPYFSENYDKVFSSIEECVIQLAKYCIN